MRAEPTSSFVHRRVFPKISDLNSLQCVCDAAGRSGFALADEAEWIG